MGRGSSHSEANASKALQVPGEASHAGVFHPQASELSHLLPAPRGAAAAGRAHSELDTRGKAAALRRRTALRGTCPPPGTGTGPGPQARQGLSRTPSPVPRRRVRGPAAPDPDGGEGEDGASPPAARSALCREQTHLPTATTHGRYTRHRHAPFPPGLPGGGGAAPECQQKCPGALPLPGSPRAALSGDSNITTAEARRSAPAAAIPTTSRRRHPPPPPPTGRRLTAQAPPAAPGRPRMRRTASHLPGLEWRRCAREPALARGGRGGEGVGARMRRGVDGRVRAAGRLWSVY